MDNIERTRKLQQLLGTRAVPIAIAFRDRAPAGVPRVGAAQPAGCGYWRAAAERGSAFYTEAPDHHGCPIGAHTHGVPMPPEVGKQLESMIGTMVGLEYLTPSEIPSIPTRKAPFGVAIYAPLDQAPVEPDVVMVRGNARQMMLVAEAAASAGKAGASPAMGRPTCAALPLAIESGATATSFGCIGNRVYTGLGDDEAYVAIPGGALDAILERLATIVKANDALEKFHRARLA